MKQLIITLMMILVLVGTLGSVSAEAKLGTFKQGECIDLIQTCADCSYVNISRVSYPNGTTALGQSTMTKSGSVFNRTFCSTTTTGEYNVFFIGDPEGIDTVVAYDLEVTPSGKSGNANIVFFVFIILMLYGLNLVSFFNKNIPLTILGGMALLFLGVYLIRHGIIIYRDDLTNYIAYITIATGGITAFWAILEQLDVL